MDILKGVLSLMGALGVFILILFLTYICTKFISKRYASAGFAGKHIQVLERLPLGPDRALLIVRTGGKTLLLGYTAQHIELITQLDEAQFSEPLESTQSPPDFSAILKTTLKSGWGIGAKPKDEKDTKDG